ncbi:MAG: hypothetical protein ACREP9_09515, partial [Candidatus Dormibacteraceae bacterium]
MFSALVRWAARSRPAVDPLDLMRLVADFFVAREFKLEVYVKRTFPRARALLLLAVLALLLVSTRARATTITYNCSSSPNVLINPHIHVILWGWGDSGDPSGELNMMEGLLAGIGGRSPWNTLTQYYQGNSLSCAPQTYLPNPDPLPYDVVTSSDFCPAGPTFVDQTNELNSWSLWYHDPSAILVLVYGLGHNPPGLGFQPNGVYACAYHNNLTTSYLNAYAVLQYESTANLPFCGATLRASVQQFLQHEIAESITDPFGFNSGILG